MRYGMYTDTTSSPIALPSPAYKPLVPVPSRTGIASGPCLPTQRPPTLPASWRPSSNSSNCPRDPERVPDVHCTPATRLRRMRVTWTECDEARGKSHAAQLESMLEFTVPARPPDSRVWLGRGHGEQAALEPRQRGAIPRNPRHQALPCLRARHQYEHVSSTWFSSADIVSGSSHAR